LNTSLNAIYQKERQGLFTLALSITRSIVLAEDAIQDAFVKLMKVDLPSEPELKPYVYKAVRFTAIDTLRSNKRQQSLAESIFCDASDHSSEHSPSENALTEERSAILREAIEQLPLDEREAVVLKAFAGLTFRQSADTAGVPLKTIATRYRRALQKLETRLKGKL